MMYYATPTLNHSARSLQRAQQMDAQDALRAFRSQYHFPLNKEGRPCTYLCGHSLGLQHKETELATAAVFKDWREYGIDGYFHCERPWYQYHEQLIELLAPVLGAKTSEVAIMNTLSVNLHLMLASFYQPTPTRYKILIESKAFPSDIYAIKSWLKLRGYDPTEAIIELSSAEGEQAIEESTIESVLTSRGSEIALVLIGGVNYFTGQVFDFERITELAHQQGCKVGFDVAHAAGNVVLQLHEWQVDFAVGCTYKYLNGGPGSIATCFVHERFHKDNSLNRLEGWWGNKPSTRFQMTPTFDPIEGAQAWAISCPPIFGMATLERSLKVFNTIGMEALRQKSIGLIHYLDELLAPLEADGIIEILTPKSIDARANQWSIRLKRGGRAVFERLLAQGVIGDWREPNLIRIALAPTYNSYEDAWQFYNALKNSL